MEDFLANLPGYLEIALSVVGAAAVIATFTANKSDDKVIQIILNLINWLGANFGEAKNKPSPQKSTGPTPPPAGGGKGGGG